MRFLKMRISIDANMKYAKQNSPIHNFLTCAIIKIAKKNRRESRQRILCKCFRCTIDTDYSSKRTSKLKVIIINLNDKEMPCFKQLLDAFPSLQHSCCRTEIGISFDQEAYYYSCACKVRKDNNENILSDLHEKMHYAPAYYLTL